jgi:hypothetical protein
MNSKTNNFILNFITLTFPIKYLWTLSKNVKPNSKGLTPPPSQIKKIFLKTLTFNFSRKTQKILSSRQESISKTKSPIDRSFNQMLNSVKSLTRKLLTEKTPIYFNKSIAEYFNKETSKKIRMILSVECPPTVVLKALLFP